MNEKEKVNYLKALMFIALADDKVEESEKHYFEQIGAMYGLSKDQINEIYDSILKGKDSIEEILNGITERTTKLTLLYDLLALCYVEENYSLAEKNGMKNICNIMGIENTKLIEIESAMEEQLALQKKINTILER